MRLDACLYPNSSRHRIRHSLSLPDYGRGLCQPKAHYAAGACAGAARDASYSIYLAQVQTVSLASRSIASLVPVIPSLLLVIVTSGIVVALGLLLNILAERPLLSLCRRIGQCLTGAHLIPGMRASGK